ncbi:MAG: NAD(P)/FAD-dependent oxidoreductase [Clostridiales Family XIII bacterium]|jgi:2,4-dienoyl-CoA reductase-like NADH-dependent reductase (Old Yellow Enzyme family)/siroheme synthase (precorrin-2 oxidase/ferrochelatase)|nr:NAD(P)/FAD-dependent oxidoreductase [Clostridiales Family XIII bacterium]
MATFNRYQHLFTPLKVGTTEYRSRVEFSPMVCDMTNSLGEPTQGYIDFVEKQAETGVSIIHLGATPVDQKNSVDYRAELDVTDEGKIAGLVMIAEAAHRHGSKISVELVHAGRGADPELITTEYAIAPSNFSIPDRAAYIKVMDNRDIDDVINSFVDCALRLQRCKFDGVLIHGAHGNLIAQFLSPRTNTRNDEWGGDAARRRRFPLKLLKAMREAVGPDFILELRISGDEIFPDGMHTPEVIDFLIEAQQYIDIVNVSAGLIVEEFGRFYSMPPYFRKRGANVPFASQIKNHPDINIPVSVAGGMITADMVEEYIAKGDIDGVSMARALLADPDMLNKSYRGLDDRIRPCLRCWMCAGGYGTHIHCAVNPQLARTFRYSKVWKANRKKKVVVVGGGVAGTQAARTLVQRGHDVVLFEKSGELGGHLTSISKLSFKDDMLFYTEWIDRETKRLVGEENIRLNTEATADIVMAEKPDAIVVAVGSVPARPPIPGLDEENVYNVLDVDSGRKEIPGGSKVVVCGGGLSGCESALALAMKGCDVTIVDMIPLEDFALGGHDLSRRMLLFMLKNNRFDLMKERDPDMVEGGKASLIGSSLVRSVSGGKVVIEDKNWKTQTIEADYIVEAFGMKKNQEMADRFFELIPDVYYVGDCYEVKHIMNANFTAYDRASNI